MKLRRLSAAVLITAIGAGLVLPAAASATSVVGDPFIGDGTVKIKAGDINTTNPIPDPEIPGIIKPVDPVKPNDNPGKLGIVRVWPLKFDDIETSSRNDLAGYPAAAVEVEKIDENGDPAGTGYRGHMVQFEDARGNRAGYTVTAQMTQQFTLNGTSGATAETLDNATIEYTKGIMTNHTGATPGTLTPSFTLGQDATDATPVVVAAKDQGSAEFMLEFGQSTDYTGVTEDTSGNAVFLKIPDPTFSNMVVGDYTAKITWTIVEAPTTP